MLADAITLGRQGATDFEVAQAFGVSPAVITYWRSKDPDFDRALRVHAEVADDRVERALFHKATGYSFHAEKIHVSADGVVTRVPYIEHVAPDNTAMIFWLKNRRRDRWRDQQDVKVEGEVKHTVDARQAALALLAVLRSAAEDNAKTIEHEPE